MSGITLTQAQEHLDAWLDNDLALAKGKIVTVAGRSITRDEARSNIEYWDRQVKRLTRGGIKIFGGTPVG